jgi:hypothetical protein
MDGWFNKQQAFSDIYFWTVNTWRRPTPLYYTLAETNEHGRLGDQQGKKKDTDIDHRKERQKHYYTPFKYHTSHFGGEPGHTYFWQFDVLYSILITPFRLDFYYWFYYIFLPFTFVWNIIVLIFERLFFSDTLHIFLTPRVTIHFW